MNIFGRIAIVVGLLGTLVACDQVPVGYVGIKVHQLGGSKGVDQEVITPGRVWVGWNESLFIFPTFTQNYMWDKAQTKESPGDESITFQTREGLNVNSDIGIQYTLKPDKIPYIFQKYRRGINEITNVFLRNEVRDALVNEASKMDVESIYGVGKGAFVDAVEKQVREKVESQGIIVEKIYIIGEFRLPPNVVQSINAKIAATQMAQQRENEVRQAKAEADKSIEAARGRAESVRIEAEAQAKANRLLAESVSDSLIQFQAVQKWDGNLPQVVGGAVPMISVPMNTSQPTKK